MASALTILIASSVGWSAPEARPAPLELELIVVTVETAVLERSELPTATCASATTLTSGPSRPASPRNLPAMAPAMNDVRAAIVYDCSLPYFRTKP